MYIFGCFWSTAISSFNATKNSSSSVAISRKFHFRYSQHTSLHLLAGSRWLFSLIGCKRRGKIAMDNRVSRGWSWYVIGSLILSMYTCDCQLCTTYIPVLAAVGVSPSYIPNVPSSLTSLDLYAKMPQLF